MKIIVDTCIWSLALRRPRGQVSSEVDKLYELISDSRVQMLGPIRQEILSGIKDKEQFNRLCKALQAYPDHELIAEDYESAARLFNLCRSKGIQGSNTDFLICAVSVRTGMPIFTHDKDFRLYQSYTNIDLFEQPIP